MAILALVALISRRIQNFRRTAGLTFSAFHDWSIEQSVSVQTSDYEQNTLEYTYQWNETVFFPETSTDFVFQKLPEEIQSKIVYFCSVIKRIFTPQSRCSLHAILTQMIRFWIPPMMLTDRSAHTTRGRSDAARLRRRSSGAGGHPHFSGYFWKWRVFFVLAFLPQGKLCFQAPETQSFENGLQSGVFWKRRLSVFVWTDKNGGFWKRSCHTYTSVIHNSGR